MTDTRGGTRSTLTVGVNTASLAGYSLAEALRVAAELGFQAVELLAFEGASHSQGELCGVWFRDLDTAGQDQLLRLLEPFPRRSLHAPFVDAPLLTYNQRTRACAVAQVEETIDLDAFWGELLDVYRRLGDYALERGGGVRLGVETGYPEGAADFARLVQAIDHPAVGATIDVGHVRGCVPRERWGTPEGIAELNDHIAFLLQTLGEKIMHFHIHDVRRADFRDHRELGDAGANGVIDFARLATQVTASGYAGLWILELEEPDREAALRRSRDFLAAMLDQQERNVL